MNPENKNILLSTYTDRTYAKIEKTIIHSGFHRYRGVDPASVRQFTCQGNQSQGGTHELHRFFRHKYPLGM